MQGSRDHIVYGSLSSAAPEPSAPMPQGLLLCRPDRSYRGAWPSLGGRPGTDLGDFSRLKSSWFGLKILSVLWVWEPAKFALMA